MEKILLVISAACIAVCVAFGFIGAFDAPGKNEYTSEMTENETSDSFSEEDTTVGTHDTELSTVAADITVETAPLSPETEAFSEVTTAVGTETETESEIVTALETSWQESDTYDAFESDSAAFGVTETEYATEHITEGTTEAITTKVTEEVTETEPPVTDEIAFETEAVPLTDGRSEIKVPILMYHALTENADEASSTVITVEAFREQMAAITEMGYSSVFFSDIRDYVINGTPLPEKPILITFDDGYSSNLELAGTILAEYGHRATVSVIGVSVGKDTYKDTGIPIYPHFSLEEAREAYGSRIFDFQSHTFDMHQNEYDIDPRHGMLRKENESDEEYRAALIADFKRSKELMEQAIGNEVFVIIYPHGRCTETADNILLESGAEISVTVEEGINLLKRGDGGTLRFLRRFNMDDSISGEELCSLLGSYTK